MPGTEFYKNNIEIFLKSTILNFSISYQLLHGHRAVPMVQNIPSSTSLAREEKIFIMWTVTAFLCNCTPAQHPHNCQYLGTNSLLNAVSDSFLLLGNSHHNSFTRRKSRVSDNIFMRLILTSNLRNIIGLFPMFLYVYMKIETSKQTLKHCQENYFRICFLCGQQTPHGPKDHLCHIVSYVYLTK